MPDLDVRGIVLARKDSGESDRRVWILTEIGEVIDAIAKGSRKVTSRLAAITEPLSFADFHLAFGKHRHYITQGQLLASGRQLRTDYDRLGLALAFAEILLAVLPSGKAHVEAYQLCHLALEALETHERPLIAFLWIQSRLMSLSGFGPSYDRCAVSGRSLTESPGWFSMSAGGYVSSSESGQFTDRVSVRGEVLIALARLPLLDASPANIKFADECLDLILFQWRHITEKPLPALQAASDALRMS